MAAAATNRYYSKGGKLKKVTDPYSNSTTYTYDTAGRRTKVTDPLGNETVTAYYDDGSVKYTQQKNKIATDTYVTYSHAFWYDSDGRKVAEADYGTGSLPDPWPSSAPSSSDTVHVTTYTYDKLGRTTKVTDPEGMETTYAYDQMGRKTEHVRDAATGGEQIKTTWTYDAWLSGNEAYMDSVRAWEDGSNYQETRYQYLDDHHPEKVTHTSYPDNDTVWVEYNRDGTVDERHDLRGWYVSYTYDDAQRVTQEDVGGTSLVGTDTVTYAYDALGRPTSATDNNDPDDNTDNSTIEWTYTREADGDLKVEETQKYSGLTNRKVTYTYDLSGRLKTMDYPSAQTLSYTYDALGRRTVVTAGSYDLVTDTWKGQLLEKREYYTGAYLTHLNDSGGSLSGYGYDTFGRIKNHRWKDSSGTLLAGWSHDYDRVGNKLYQEALHDSTESELYGYDGVYRLTGFERGQLNANKDDIASPTRSQRWTLDPLGNWDDTTIDSATETRTHNSVNELTARTPSGGSQIDLTYDDAGNLTQDGDSDGDHKYTWDYRNRLIEVQEKQSGTWTTIAEYTYDAKNRRVVKEVTNKGSLNGTTHYIWGAMAVSPGGGVAWQCLQERDGDGDLVAQYTYAPGQPEPTRRRSAKGKARSPERQRGREAMRSAT